MQKTVILLAFTVQKAVRKNVTCKIGSLIWRQNCKRVGVDLEKWYKLENESDDELIYRVCRNKDLIGTWQDVADIINSLTDSDFGESTYRKKFQSFEKILNANQAKFANSDAQLQELRLQKQEIQKEKRKLFDERLDLNRRLREEARHETTIEKIEGILSDIGTERYVSYAPTYSNGNEDLIVMLSDLHIGAEYYNFDGCYNSSIAKDRLNEYLNNIIEIQSTHRAKNCVVVLCGDEISGSIHHSISVTNKENVVEQVKLACTYISDFLYELGKHFLQVEVYSVPGNHSRLAKKEDALLSERLDDLVIWFAKSMLKEVKNVTIYDDNVDDTLASFFVKDKLYFAVHGDWDATTQSGISKLVLWAKMTPYCVLCGHKHYPAMSDISDIKVVQSGSLCGSGDDFTRQKRLTGKPSQTVLVVNEKGIKCCYPVTLH